MDEIMWNHTSSIISMVFNAAGPERPMLPTSFNPYKMSQQSGHGADDAGNLIEAFERSKRGSNN